MKQNIHNLAPAQYWRDNKNWSKLIGKTGTVLLSTNIDNLYSYVLLELDCDVDINGIINNDSNNIENKKQKIECMSEVNTFLEAGEKVVLQLRKLSESSKNGLINYGIKATKRYE